MNKLHENHSKHLTDLKSKITLANGMLKTDGYLTPEQHEHVSQEKAINEMMFENGLKAFANPLHVK